MNTKIALKALKFAFLPTIIILLFMIIGCFSFVEPLKFLISDSTGAIWLRVILVLTELGTFFVVYFSLLSALPLEDMSFKSISLQKTLDRYDRLRDVHESADKFEIYNTTSPSIKILKIK